MQPDDEDDVVVENSQRRLTRGAGASRLLPVIVALALGIPGGFVFARMIHIPLVETLDTYRPNIITRLYSHDGKPFSEYAIQRRQVVRLKDISPFFVQAVVSTEDANFYKHGGVDPRAIMRAGIKDLIARKKVEGASTLTQQLARQVFLTPEKNFRRKLNEIFLAVDIEKNLTKDQIFELYANQVYLGHGAYGVEAAARVYFGKHAKDLTVPEAALIAGLIRLPSYYDPINNPTNGTNRRNHVLRRMLECKYITPEEFRRSLATPLVLGTYKDDNPKVGAYFAEEVRQYLEKNYGTADLYRNGLEVRTTLDIDIQRIAEESLKKGLRAFDKRRGFRKPVRNLLNEGLNPEEYKDAAWEDNPAQGKLYPAVVLRAEARETEIRVGKERVVLKQPAWAWTNKPSLAGLLKRGDLVSARYDLDPKTKVAGWYLDQLPQVQGAIVVLDVKTGEVRALVGGYDFTTSKFDRAVQSLRQTGSGFKPFVYGAAFEKGFTPADTLFDSPIALRVGNQTYTPHNFHGEYSGIVTIQRALELSINIPAVKTYTMIGGASVIDFARRCGLTAPLPPYPSLALGAAGVSPMEMTAAYNVFANQGVYSRPRLITRITDATQKVLEENYPELSEATTAQTAYLMTHVMEGVIDRGTGYEAHTLPGALAGKTGTTNGFTDAWFMGFSPEFCVGVWVGYDDPSRSLGGGATGADVALPIWSAFFKEIDAQKLRGPIQEAFEMPPGVVIVPMDLKTGRRGVGPCGRIIQEAFLAGTEPNRDCSGTAVAVSKLPYYLQRPFYEPKELEPLQVAPDATAHTGEGAESPAPPIEAPEPSGVGRPTEISTSTSR
ncbi:MAG TPA: PBP1A family penicillin-binding protein [Thermoanaerobaculia bacterium]|nr:PBP1A family penicillin-binding protein [Thermoanaerobaculia bacterium]